MGPSLFSKGSAVWGPFLSVDYRICLEVLLPKGFSSRASDMG